MIIKTQDVLHHLHEYLGRYEYVQGRSAKFWECLKDANKPSTYATRWGAIRLTVVPRSNSKFNMSEYQAAAKIAEKINKGYRQVNHSNDTMQVRFTDDISNRLRDRMNMSPALEEEQPPASRPRSRL